MAKSHKLYGLVLPVILLLAGGDLMVDYKKILHSVNEVLKEKGKRKFVQTVDLAVNFKGIDFKKPENRINIDIVLPNGRERG